MRGKATGGNNHSWFVRITPAYAGKRKKQKGSLIVIEDHPRLCGEKKALDRADDRKKGSPPPMRGKVLPCEHCKTLLGITPAYAGKSGIRKS